MDLTVSTNDVIFSTMPSHIEIILFLKSSFVSHKCLKAATRTAITATAIRIGAEIPPIAVPTFEKIPDSFVIIPGKPLMKPCNFLKFTIALPTAPISVPITINSGPIEATINAIAAIKPRVCGVILLSLSTTPCNHETSFFIFGRRTSPKEIASS